MFDREDSILGVDGEEIAGEGDIGANAQAGLRIGERHDGGSLMNGWISEVVVYNRRLNRGEHQRVVNYLLDRWGL